MDKSLGQQIKEARMDRGISQEQAAREIGVTLRTVQLWEAGAEPAPLGKAKIMRFLEKGVVK